MKVFPSEEQQKADNPQLMPISNEVFELIGNDTKNDKSFTPDTPFVNNLNQAYSDLSPMLFHKDLTNKEITEILDDMMKKKNFEKMIPDVFLLKIIQKISLENTKEYPSLSYEYLELDLIPDLELNSLLNGKSIIAELGMSLLNYIAYYKNGDMMNYLFQIIKRRNCKIEMVPDNFKKDPLQIAIEYKDKFMIDVLIVHMTDNPPEFNKWPNLSRDLFESLFVMKIGKLGALLDSRCFLIRLPRRLADKTYTDKKFITKSVVLEKDQTFEHSINEFLARHNRPTDKKKEYIQEIELFTTDIVNIAQQEIKGSFLGKILNNYEKESEIYDSKFLKELLYSKWMIFGKHVFASNFIIVVIEILIYFVCLANVIENFKFGIYGISQNYLYLVCLWGSLIIVIYGEIKELKNAGFWNYIYSEKNIMDVIFTILFTIINFITTIAGMAHYTLENNSFYYETFLFLRAFLYVSFLVRCMYIFKIIPKIGFYLRMITYTFKFMLMFLLLFVVLLLCLTVSINSAVFYDDWSVAIAQWFFSYFAFYKLSFGDFSDYFTILPDQNVKSTVLYYFFFFLSSILFSILLLNLVIAILSDGYGKMKDLEDKCITREDMMLIHETNLYTKFITIKEIPHNQIYKRIAFHVGCIFIYLIFHKILIQKKIFGSLFIYSRIKTFETDNRTLKRNVTNFEGFLSYAGKTVELENEINSSTKMHK